MGELKPPPVEIWADDNIDSDRIHRLLLQATLVIQNDFGLSVQFKEDDIFENEDDWNEGSGRSAKLWGLTQNVFSRKNGGKPGRHCNTIFQSLVTEAQKSSDRTAALEKAQEENLTYISCLKDEISTWRSTTESCLMRIENLAEQNKILNDEKDKAAHQAMMQIEDLIKQNKVLANEKHMAARQAIREFRQSEAGKSWVEDRAAEWFTTGFTRCQDQFEGSGMFPLETDLGFLDMEQEMPTEYSVPPFNPGLSNTEEN